MRAKIDNEGDLIPATEIQYDLSDDKLFWRDVEREVYGTMIERGLKANDLARFEGFCENFREGGDTWSELETGQSVSSIGHFPGLRAHPVHDTAADGFEWVPEFKARLGVIREEFSQYTTTQEMNGRSHWGAVSTVSHQGSGESFNTIYLAKGGVFTKEIARHFPRTRRLLSDLGMPGTGGVTFNRQKPKTGLPRHSEAITYLLAGHVGINIPAQLPECGMELYDQKCAWREDELLIIDNSFPHHTWNDTDEPRDICFFNFFHPDLTVPEKEALVRFDDVYWRHISIHHKQHLKSVQTLNRLIGLS